MNAIDKIFDSRGIQKILLHISRPRFNRAWSIQTAQLLSRWCSGNEGSVSLNARQALARILLYIPERDDHWIALAKDQLGIPEHVLRDNIVNKDSISHYFFLHMTREVIRNDSWNLIDLTFLSRLSKFDIHNAHPGLQTESCDLWNEIVLDARSRWTFLSSKRVSLLRKIRHHYIKAQKLHRSPSALPLYLPILFCLPYGLIRCATLPTHHANISTPPPPILVIPITPPLALPP